VMTPSFVCVWAIINQEHLLFVSPRFRSTCRSQQIKSNPANK
jgi:hypothetical protein